MLTFWVRGRALCGSLCEKRPRGGVEVCGVEGCESAGGPRGSGCLEPFDWMDSHHSLTCAYRPGSLPCAVKHPCAVRCDAPACTLFCPAVLFRLHAWAALLRFFSVWGPLHGLV